MAAWEKQVAGDQPAWVVVRPEVEEESTGGREVLSHGRRLVPGPGLCADQAHGRDVGEDRRGADHGVSAGAAHRSRTCRWTGPGRSIKGTAALTEFRVEAAPADGKGKPVAVKFSRATADVNPPETPLEPIFDDKSGKKRVTGPVGFAIDGKDETAWGIDVGPGRRNQPRKAVFTAEKPIAFPGGTILTFHLTQNHGGWNSDDNQNHNLGRFRLAITTAPGADGRPGSPARPRDPGDPTANSGPPPRSAAVFSYWRTTVPEWKEANAWIESLWRQHPEGSTQLVLAERDKPRPTHLLQRGDFLKPAKHGRARACRRS